MSAPVCCERCESELEPGDLRCPVCSAAREGDLPQDAPHTQVLRCTDCNAVMRYDPKHQAAACPFCGAKLELERPTDPIEQAEEFVPFAFDRNTALAAIHDWFRRRPLFAPGDLARRARVDEAVPVLWAAWVVSGHSQVHFTADEEGAGRRARWGPRVGSFSRPLAGVLVPGTRGLTLSEVVSLHDYDLATATHSPPENVVLEDFGVTRSAARSAIGEGVRNDALATAVRNTRGRLRHTKVEVVLSKIRTRRVLLPVWIAAYRYRDRLYRVVLHGQHPRSVVGVTPVSWMRVAAAVGAGLLAVTLLLAVLFFLRRR